MEDVKMVISPLLEVAAPQLLLKHNYLDSVVIVREHVGGLTGGLLGMAGAA
jgi:hypothetical protein